VEADANQRGWCILCLVLFGSDPFFFFILKKTGIELTESLAMSPAASVSGLYFASPSASYFSLGKIGEDQIKDYSARKQSSVDDVERWLGSSLSYK
jgi:5-methyltetrahydrofolate--homocysteine methyltransferase